MFADLTPAELGSWLIVFAAVVGLVGAAFFAWNQARHALFPRRRRRPPGSRLVTHADLDKLKAEQLGYATKEEFREMKTELKEAVEKAHDYAHGNFHKLRGALHVQNLRLVAVMAKLGVEMTGAAQEAEQT